MIASPAALLSARERQLSPRELQVVRLLAEGRNAKQIADALRIAERTAYHHMLVAMQRYRAKTYAELVLAVERDGLLAA